MPGFRNLTPPRLFRRPLGEELARPPVDASALARCPGADRRRGVRETVIADAGSNAALPMPSLRQGRPTKTPPAAKAGGSLAGNDSSSAISTRSPAIPDPVMVPSLKS